jgi:hypothetical protein
MIKSISFYFILDNNLQKIYYQFNTINTIILDIRLY